MKEYKSPNADCNRFLFLPEYGETKTRVTILTVYVCILVCSRLVSKLLIILLQMRCSELICYVTSY